MQLGGQSSRLLCSEGVGEIGVGTVPALPRIAPGPKVPIKISPGVGTQPLSLGGVGRAKNSNKLDSN
jgi:hypothetical protein